MIACKKCGFQNQDNDTFCGSCGGFLEWTGEKVAPKISEEVVQEAETAAQAPRKGILSAVQSIVFADVGKATPMERAAGPGGAPGGAPRPGMPGAPRPGMPGAGPPRPGMPGAGPPPPGAAVPPRPGMPGAGPPPRPGMPGAGPPPPGAPGVPPRPPAPGAGPPPPGAAVPPRPAGGLPPAPAAPHTAPAGASLPGEPRGPQTPVEPHDEGDEDDEEPPDPPPSVAGALVVPVDPARPGPALPARPAPSSGRPTSEGPEPDEGQPAAVAPQAAKKRQAAATKTKSTRRLNPGDQICGECGEGNAPNRKFCSRCGTSLVGSGVVADPWWRRLLPKPKTLKAGGRPGQPGVKVGWHLPELSRILRPLRWIVGLICLTCGVLFSVYAPARNWATHQVSRAENVVSSDLHPQYTPVRPSGASATAQLPDHSAQLAVDQFKNTYWALPADTKDPALTLTFEQSTNLDRALFTSGASDNFAGTDRPEQLHLVFSNGKSDDITLKDQADPQQVNITNGHGITWVQIHIKSVYQSVTGTNVAISEIELFSRKS